MTDQEKLRQAQVLVGQVLEGLDRRMAHCVHCGINTYAYWNQELVARQLEGVSSKLTKMADDKVFNNADR